MTFDQLRCFLTAAEYLNFSKAADVLFLSHSAISRNILNLEKDLGVTLMERDNREVRLTPKGELLKIKAKFIMSALDNIEGEIRNADDEIPEILTISSVCLYNEALFCAYMEFIKRHPHMRIYMRDEDFVTVCERVRDRSSDVGITYSFTMSAEEEDGIAGIDLLEEEFCVIASRKHPLAEKNIITLDELKKAKVLAYSESSDSISGVYNTHLFLREIDMRSGLHSFHFSRMQARSIADLMLMVRAGIGVALLPESMAMANAAGCKLIPIADLDSSYRIILQYRKDNQYHSLAQFLNEMRQLIPPHK